MTVPRSVVNVTARVFHMENAIIAGRSVREAGMCCDRHNIYLIGGKPDDLAASRFDVCLGLWTALPEMIRPRRCAGKRE